MRVPLTVYAVAEGYLEAKVTDSRAGHPSNPMRIEVKLTKKP